MARSLLVVNVENYSPAYKLKTIAFATKKRNFKYYVHFFEAGNC